MDLHRGGKRVASFSSRCRETVLDVIKQGLRVELSKGAGAAEGINGVAGREDGTLVGQGAQNRGRILRDYKGGRGCCSGTGGGV